MLDRVLIAIGAIRRDAAAVRARLSFAGASVATGGFVAANNSRKIQMECGNTVAGLLVCSTDTLRSC